MEVGGIDPEFSSMSPVSMALTVYILHSTIYIDNVKVEY
jgi:hypothetical protein